MGMRLYTSGMLPSISCCPKSKHAHAQLSPTDLSTPEIIHVGKNTTLYELHASVRYAMPYTANRHQYSCITDYS